MIWLNQHPGIRVMITTDHILNVLLETLEDRLPWLRKEFPRLSDDYFRDTAKTDPTGYTYTPWLVRQRGKAGELGWPGLSRLLRRLLVDFHHSKKRNDFTGNRDINSYEDFYALNHAMEDYENVRTNQDVNTEKAAEGTEELNRFRSFRLVKFNNADAAMAFSAQGRLCTVGRTPAREYVRVGNYGIYRNGVPYVMISKREWRTVDDKYITPVVYAEIRPLVINFPEIIEDVPLAVPWRPEWVEYPEVQDFLRYVSDVYKRHDSPSDVLTNPGYKRGYFYRGSVHASPEQTGTEEAYRRWVAGENARAEAARLARETDLRMRRPPPL